MTIRTRVFQNRTARVYPKSRFETKMICASVLTAATWAVDYSFYSFYSHTFRTRLNSSRAAAVAVSYYCYGNLIVQRFTRRPRRSHRTATHHYSRELYAIVQRGRRWKPLMKITENLCSAHPCRTYTGIKHYCKLGGRLGRMKLFK